MAGNKMSAKTKTKDDKSKTNKNIANEESEDLDCTILRKPILTSITGFAQATKIFDLATEELKNLLTNECDILYECKVCRNIFRSLANFISHKRIYCKEKFSNSVHGHFVRTLSVSNEISRINKLEELYNESLKEGDSGIFNQKSFDDRIPLTKDLTEIIERITSARGKEPNQVDKPELVLQRIPKSSVAVFQNFKDADDNVTDLMRAQVNELNMLISRENAVLNADGTFEVQSSCPIKQEKESESVIQISDDENNEDNDILKCKICDLQFSTQKTLKFHMKYKHLDSRLVYPCPDCLEIFSTSWSVYRHLFKIHRKTAAQIRRLRESIQAKAFRMNNPPAFYEKRKNNAKNVTQQKISEEERLDQENQAWMDDLEGDGEVPRCGGCGRTFERRAALAAHTHTCQPRSRALARRPPDARRIEIQIRKDYNKAPPPSINLPLKIVDLSEIKHVDEDSSNQKLREKEKAAEQVKNDKCNENVQNKSSENMVIDLDESPSKVKYNEIKCTSKLPFARLTEKNNFNTLIKRCQQDVEMDKLRCKKCDSNFIKVLDLYEHMAEHYKWLRYACKLCNFKHYSFEKLPEHVKVVHKLKGDTDFYYSTVKAIDGTEALQLAVGAKDTNDSGASSPLSRRPSRCSSDSSRLSDDSSSSSTRVEGTRKRKMKYNKTMIKKKKESEVIDVNESCKDSEASNDMLDDNDSANAKVFEENSSDIDEVEDKLTKKAGETPATISSSRRPVRKRTNKKNEDFEYDLSNLLKMEAQGYRESQTVVTTKTIPAKKKSPVENQINNVLPLDKDCTGALAMLSKKAVGSALAHMKSVCLFAQEVRPSNIFLRPLLPKVTRVEKVSPKKDTPIQVSDTSVLNKAITQANLNTNEIEKDVKTVSNTSNNAVQEKPPQEEDKNPPKNDVIVSYEDKLKPSSDLSETPKAKLNIPTVVPFKLRRQSLDLMKNPMIKKNITDFSKAGMKTKILVIKPINRNNQQDGGKTINTPLKFQTIKLKDPNKSSTSSEDKVDDKIRVVQVPKVDCTVKLPAKGSTCVVNNDTNLSKAITTKIDSANTAINEKVSEIINENNNAQKDVPNDITGKTPEDNMEVEPSNKDKLSGTKEPLHTEEMSSSLEKNTEP